MPLDQAEYIRRLVDAAPPLTAEQRHKLSALLSPAAEVQSAEMRSQRHAEETKARVSVRRNLARRKSPEDLAAEAIAARLAARRANRPPEPDPVVVEALRIQEQLGVSWTDAYANAKALKEARRRDADRRREHADGHMWCVPSECSAAWDADDD